MFRVVNGFLVCRDGLFFFGCITASRGTHRNLSKLATSIRIRICSQTINSILVRFVFVQSKYGMKNNNIELHGIIDDGAVF